MDSGHGGVGTGTGGGELKVSPKQQFVMATTKETNENSGEKVGAAGGVNVAAFKSVFVSGHHVQTGWHDFLYLSLVDTIRSPLTQHFAVHIKTHCRVMIW